MQEKKTSAVHQSTDRMGRFIGQLRIHEGITLSQLSHGLCSVPFLNRIENGEREIGKQMTDAFFQRLGKPVELFERILDWDEFQQWSHRQEIIASMRSGDIQAARTGIQNYLSEDADVLDQQFAKIIVINCCHLSDVDPKGLLKMVCDALLLTQPNFQTTPVDDLLLSQNEGRLLFAYFQLKERLEGFDAVSESYHTLLRYFKKPRYESRERVYLVPYVSCRVIENEYIKGHYMSALTICEETLEELTRENRLFAYARLLEWKQTLYDAIGNTDRTPEKLLCQLQLIQTYAPKQVDLLIPCDERGHVYCLNQVIRDRRKLLGISQEALAEGICDPRTLSRIENDGGNLQRKNRKLLLQRVNMSGERYDYEVITDQYEDYLLRSNFDRAMIAEDFTLAATLLDQLRQRTPDIPTNRQYILKNEATSPELSPDHLSKELFIETAIEKLEETIRLTLPLDTKNISSWPASILSINETLTLISYASYYKKKQMYEQSNSILLFIKRCLENSNIDAAFYEDLYTRSEVKRASVLSDLGNYQESNALALSCLRMSLQEKNSQQLSTYLFGIAWNLTQQLQLVQDTERAQHETEALSLLRQACAAALISGDAAIQQHIVSYCLRVYNTPFEL